MAIFTIGNLACRPGPDLRPADGRADRHRPGPRDLLRRRLAGRRQPGPARQRKASAIAIMFTGLTLATLLGVPFGARGWAWRSAGARHLLGRERRSACSPSAVLAALVPARRGGRGPPRCARSSPCWPARRCRWAWPMTVPRLRRRVRGLHLHPADPDRAGRLLEGGRLADPAGVRRRPGAAATCWAARWPTGAWPRPCWARLAILTLVTAGLGASASTIGSARWSPPSCLGAAAFATVAPAADARCCRQAGGAGQGLASSLNIAAFNLGNAFGAWLGGAVIAHGPGLAASPLVAAAVPLSALALAAFSLSLERRALRVAALVETWKETSDHGIPPTGKIGPAGLRPSASAPAPSAARARCSAPGATPTPPRLGA